VPETEHFQIDYTTGDLLITISEGTSYFEYWGGAKYWARETSSGVIVTIIGGGQREGGGRKGKYEKGLKKRRSSSRMVT